MLQFTSSSQVRVGSDSLDTDVCSEYPLVSEFQVYTSIYILKDQVEWYLLWLIGLGFGQPGPQIVSR